MSWAAYLADTMTGLLAAPIDLPSFSWSVSVSDSSLATTRDKGVGEDEGSGIRVPWSAVPASTASQRAAALCADKRSIVLAWRTGRDPEEIGTPILMGAISPRTDTASDTSFSLSSPMGMLENRFLTGDFGLNASGGTSWTKSFSNMSLRGIASEVGWLCTNAKPGGELPIDWTYRGETGTHERTYKGFNVQNQSGADILEKIADVQDGPDMQFRPYLTGDGMHVRWRFTAGSDAGIFLGQDAVHRLAYHPSGGTIEGLTVDHVGPVMRVYATGSGTDEAQLCHLSEDLSLVRSPDPWPLKEMAWSDTDTDDRSLLERHADATLAANRRPIMQIKGEIHVDDVDASGLPIHPMGSFWPGELFSLDVDGFPSLPDGTYECRLMRMDGDETDKVTLTFDVTEDPSI